MINIVKVFKKRFPFNLIYRVFIDEEDKDRFDKGEKIGGVVKILRRDKNSIGIPIRKVDFEKVNSSGICVIKRK